MRPVHVHPPGAVLLGPRVEFDGHVFNPIMTAAGLPFIYLAYLARRGDTVAAELLDKFRVKIETGYGGTTYWPVSPGGVSDGEAKVEGQDQGVEGHGGVQAGDPPLGQQEGAHGQVPQAGRGNRVERGAEGFPEAEALSREAEEFTKNRDRQRS